MRTNALKSAIIKNIANINDDSLLKEIKTLLKSNKELTLNVPASNEEEIEIARIQIKKGNFTSQDMVEKQFSKWKD